MATERVHCWKKMLKSQLDVCVVWRLWERADFENLCSVMAAHGGHGMRTLLDQILEGKL